MRLFRVRRNRTKIFLFVFGLVFGLAVLQIFSKNKLPYFKGILGSGESCGKTLAIFVISAIEERSFRDAIRETWGKFVQETYSTTVYFLLGRSVDVDDTQYEIIQEYNSFGDVIQFDLVDTYANLSLKTLAMFQWFAGNCDSDLLFKVDADVFVLPDELLKMASLMQSTYGENGEVNRDPSQKWFVSYDSYGEKQFPTYCSGQAYAMTNSAAKKILRYTQPKDLLIAIEDVIFTGVVPERAGVPRHRHPGFQLQVGGGQRRITEEMVQNLCQQRKDMNFVVHGVQSADNLTKLWKRYKACETEPGFRDRPRDQD